MSNGKAKMKRTRGQLSHANDSDVVRCEPVVREGSYILIILNSCGR